MTKACSWQNVAIDVRNFLKSDTAPSAADAKKILAYWKREALTRYTSMLAGVRVLLGLGAGDNTQLPH